MSKKRKRINETMTARVDQRGNRVRGNKAMNWPATSSTTTLPGSFFPDNCSVRVAAHIPTTVKARIKTRTTTTSELPVTTRASNKKIPTATNEPKVPGATGKYPTPQVAIDNAR